MRLPPSRSTLDWSPSRSGQDRAVHRLDSRDRDRALGFVQRIADIFSHVLEDRNVLYSRLQAIATLTTL